MAEIFLRRDVKHKLKGKRFMFLGDSILRNIYQDFVNLLECEGFTPQQDLRKKGEQMPSYAPGDKLVPGTGSLCSGRSYREVRHYISEDLSATYYFLVRCFSEELEKFLLNEKNSKGSPDVILVLSALWDINRWGPNGIKAYIKNSRDLLAFVRKNFGSGTQLIWLTCPPISCDVTGGMMLEEMEFSARSMRFNVMEANTMVAHNSAALGYDVVDLHYWMTHQLHRRLGDGVHWAQDAVRMQLHIILTHICLSRDIALPSHTGQDRNGPLAAAKALAEASLYPKLPLIPEPDDASLTSSTPEPPLCTSPIPKPYSKDLASSHSNCLVQTKKSNEFSSKSNYTKSGIYNNDSNANLTNPSKNPVKIKVEPCSNPLDPRMHYEADSSLHMPIFEEVVNKKGRNKFSRFSDEDSSD